MSLILSILIGIALLLVLILLFRVHAFLSLLIASIVSGLLAGLSFAQVLQSIQTGMGNTLGFVAVVVGLGALFGAILEHSGGAEAIANMMIRKFGDRYASAALVIAGFIIAIPVFFDVAFIILIYVVYAIKKRTGRSLLYYALPLLAGLAITHAFVPPTPGPVAVAEILGADLGWVILIGIAAGIPAAVIGGIYYSRFIGTRIDLSIPDYIDIEEPNTAKKASFYPVLMIILIPILLIIIASMISGFNNLYLFNIDLKPFLMFVGHPFTALIIANLAAWYFLGIKKGESNKELLSVSEKSLMPAGIIILLTGAGGVFKQVLMDTGAGELIALNISEAGVSYLVFAFIGAALVRIIQGSATVAMITAAALTAPLLPSEIGTFENALVVIAIASGASIFSHVNDSGFWLVNRYLGMTVPQTFKSWSALTTIISLTGFVTVLLISIFV